MFICLGCGSGLFKGSLCLCWKQNVDPWTSCLYPCMPTMRDPGEAWCNIPKFSFVSVIFFLCLNDSDREVCFFIYFLFSDSCALGWHFHGVVHCKSRIFPLHCHGWLTAHHFLCKVRMVYPTCIFDTYLYRILSAISSVIPLHKVLLQFFSQPSSSLSQINWMQQTFRSRSSLCLPWVCWSVWFPNLTSSGDRLSVLQLSASPWVNWYATLPWW